MISLLHPSRGRPEKSFTNSKDWIEKAGCDVELILSIDENDPKINDYVSGYYNEYYYSGESSPALREPKLICSHFWIEKNDNKSAVEAINHAAKVATGDIMIVVSDDFECPQDWGLKILEVTKGKVDWIAKTFDGIQKWIITLPIMDRAYYNRFGYIYHPEYLHMFCDTELTCVADLTGRKIELDIPFTHNHYSTGKSVKDEVSLRADATWNQGEKLFIERARRNFDLVNYPGKITSHEYINWMKMKGVSVQ